MAGIIGIPGRLRSESVAGFARNPRPTSSESALYAPVRDTPAPDGGDSGTISAVDVLPSVVARPQPSYASGDGSVTQPDAQGSRMVNQVLTASGRGDISTEQGAEAAVPAMGRDQGEDTPLPAPPLLAQNTARRRQLTPEDLAQVVARRQREIERRTLRPGELTSLGKVGGITPGIADGIEEPPSRDPQPPWPSLGDHPPRRYAQPRLRRRFWSAIRSLANDPNPERQIGPRLAEGLQAYFDGGGGAKEALSNGAYAELTQSTMDDVLARLRQSDPELAERIRSRRGTGARGQIEPYQLTPQEWALILRNHLDVAMRLAGGGGVQALEAIGNAAPDRGSRELAAVIPSLLFSQSDRVTIPILNQQINNVIRTLPPEVRERLPQATRRPGR